MKLFNFLLMGVLVTFLFAQGCGSSGDATKVSRDQYKKIMLQLSDTKNTKSLDDVLKANGITKEDFSAAGQKFAKDSKLMEEINKEVEASMNKDVPAAGGAEAAPSSGGEEEKED